VEVGGRRPVVVDTDQHSSPEKTLEVPAGLRPAFASGGTVNTGNASGINDGAAALVWRASRWRPSEGWAPWSHPAKTPVGDCLVWCCDVAREAAA
jgi:acetyl-CoA C-acetyltransferase